MASVPDRVPSITCPDCQKVSFHPRDVEQRYCGFCHWWTSDPELRVFRPEDEAERHVLRALMLQLLYS